jgi:hypothetical protein
MNFNYMSIIFIIEKDLTQTCLEPVLSMDTLTLS